VVYRHQVPNVAFILIEGIVSVNNLAGPSWEVSTNEITNRASGVSLNNIAAPASTVSVNELATPALLVSTNKLVAPTLANRPRIYCYEELRDRRKSTADIVILKGSKASFVDYPSFSQSIKEDPSIWQLTPAAPQLRIPNQ